MITALIILGVVVSLVVAFVVWRWYATISGGRRASEEILQRIDPVIQIVRSGGVPDPTSIRELAADPATRNTLYDALLFAKRDDVFPEQFRTPEAIAESDLVFWLRHPNELASSPDEVELMERLTRDAGGRLGEVAYFLFRFRVHEPHWAAKDGWMAGVAGPYKQRNGRVLPGAPCAFSTFYGYDAKTPDEHVDFVHQLVVKRNIAQPIRA